MRRIATALGVAAVAAALLPAAADAAFGPIGSWGGTGSANGQFNHPQAAAVDNQGRVYVADTANARIERFNSSGQWQANFGAGGGFSPTDVAIGPGGNVYAASPGRIDVWSSLGLHVANWNTHGASYGIAVDSSGNVYAGDTQTNQIDKYNPLGIYSGSFASGGSGPGQLNPPQGMTADASDHIYVADPNNARIEVFGPGGAFIGQFAMPAYTINAGNQTYRGNIFPHDVAVDAAGRVFAPDAGAHSNLVAVLGPDGSIQQLFGRPDSDPGNPCPVFAPWGVAASGSGALYVVSTGENAIRAFDEAHGPCPFPNFGRGGGIIPGGAVARDRHRPKVKIRGIPRKCARHNFSFKIRAHDDVSLKVLILFVNHKKVAKQRIGRPSWTVKVKIPVRQVRKQLPPGTSVTVLIQVKVKDTSGKKAKAHRSFRICG